MGRPAKNMALAAVDGAAVMSPARFKDREEDNNDERLLDDDLNPLLMNCAPPLHFDAFQREIWTEACTRYFWWRSSEYDLAAMCVDGIAKFRLGAMYDTKDKTALMNMLCRLGCSPMDRGKIVMKKTEKKKSGKFF